MIESKSLEDPEQGGGPIGLLYLSFFTQLLKQLIDLQPQSSLQTSARPAA